MAFRSLYDQVQGGTVTGTAGIPRQMPQQYAPAPIPKPQAAIPNPYTAVQTTNIPQATQAQMRTGQGGVPPANQGAIGQYAAPKISEFLYNVLGNVKGMNVEERATYLEDLTQGIKEKLDRFGLRLARGRVLTPEQQARYNSLQTAFNDIQGYTTNQEVYNDYLVRLGGMTPDEYAAQQKKNEEIARGTGYRGSARLGL